MMIIGCDLHARYRRLLGAPSLRLLQGRVRCCLYYEFCAQRPASRLRRSSPALYHLFRPPEIAIPGFGALPRPLLRHSRADAPTFIGSWWWDMSSCRNIFIFS